MILGVHAHPDSFRRTFFLLGRVRSIVNYDICYGIFLRGFANICAVSNSVIYDRVSMVKCGDSGRTYVTVVSLLTPAWSTSTERATDRCRFGFFPSPSLFSTSSSLFQHEKEIKNKLSTDSPCFGLLRVEWSKENSSFENLWRSSILPKMINHENFGEARVAGRASRVSASLRRNGRRRRTIEACSTFPEWVQGKNRKKKVVATQKGRLSSEKMDTWPQGKTSLGCCAIGHERKENYPKIKK